MMDMNDAIAIGIVIESWTSGHGHGMDDGSDNFYFKLGWPSYLTILNR